MGKEIERKFLVRGDEWRSAEAVYYCQGYLSRSPEATVRVRLAGDEAFLTVKSPNRGAVRGEWEYTIPPAEAREMLDLCPAPPVEKYRRKIGFAGFTWEVDEFLGENAGLIVAEIELEFETQTFELPPWTGREVTGRPEYYNSSLSVNPYKGWRN